MLNPDGTVADLDAAGAGDARDGDVGSWDGTLFKTGKPRYHERNGRTGRIKFATGKTNAKTSGWREFLTVTCSRGPVQRTISSACLTAIPFKGFRYPLTCSGPSRLRASSEIPNTNSAILEL